MRQHNVLSSAVSETSRVLYAWSHFLATDIMLSALYAIANPFDCLSVCVSVALEDQAKTVEVGITQFSPYSGPIPLLFAVGL